MDLEQIRAFVNVATQKSFSEAAEKMFISQPSVSVRIKALEEELGVILLTRSKAREPVLTEAGRIFLDYAHSMMKLQDDCREKLSGQRENATGLIYVGASTVPGTYLIPGLLARFKKITTSIDFNVNILDTSAVLEGVLNYSYDLGFVGLVKHDERLKYIALAEDELVLCSSKGLLNGAAQSETISAEGVPVETLTAYHLLIREKGSATRQLLENKLSMHGCSIADFQGVTYINSLEGVKQAVKENLGVAVISRLSVQDMVEAGAVDVFSISDLDLRRALYLVYHHSRVLGGAAKMLKDFTIEQFTAHPEV